jgi:hypothetical protein
MKHTTPSEGMDWEEKVWDIVGEVLIPAPRQLDSHYEVISLFDVCMRGTQDEEGIWLVNKLQDFIQSLLIEERSKRDEQWIKAMGKDIEISKDDNFCLQSMIVARNELRKEILNKLQINNK